MYHPQVPAKVWNTRRKLMGNLVPIVGALPFGAAGLAMAIAREGMIGPQLAVFGLMPVVGWLLMNFVGLWENRAIRAELENKLNPPRESNERQVVFVGAARPSYHGLLDPHEDVGFLIVEQDRIQLLGEELRFSLAKKDLYGAHFRPNAHTMVGLGRWISVEGKMEDTPIRLLIEPREKQTLWGNRRLSKGLQRRLQAWIKS